MTRVLLLGVALAPFAIAPALSGDVPFAEPPPPGLEQHGPQVTSLADIMEAIQLRHIKLWYAIKFKNWDLIDYELAQTQNGFANAAMLYRNIPIEYVLSATKPLAALQEASKSKDGSKLKPSFDDLTKGCNSCHQAAQVKFILIETPTSSPFSDQEFAPK